ncbi:hypothetical protein HU200_006608 [Digitaria exilis]|uniref:Uncharacterized protein n=1 Tax=Digitaria exilis TaxID=1010633 RepID=A0A835FPT0_9POAL|nr:hypothetical protein HU200_006608 [Digitaria exilis]
MADERDRLVDLVYDAGGGKVYCVTAHGDVHVFHVVPAAGGGGRRVLPLHAKQRGGGLFAPPYDAASKLTGAKNIFVSGGSLYQVWRNTTCAAVSRMMMPGGGGGGGQRIAMAKDEVFVPSTTPASGGGLAGTRPPGRAAISGPSSTTRRCANAFDGITGDRHPPPPSLFPLFDAFAGFHLTNMLSSAACVLQGPEMPESRDGRRAALADLSGGGGGGGFLHQEGGLAGILAARGIRKPLSAAVYFALQEQGEPAASLGLEGHADEEEEPAS